MSIKCKIESTLMDTNNEEEKPTKAIKNYWQPLYLQRWKKLRCGNFPRRVDSVYIVILSIGYKDVLQAANLRAEGY